ncbi:MULTISPECIES: BREX-1 system adenine-specific DNA-methyltransferase PglX [unclassified Arthrobacter]|uniref:BREX-1 system adenine-specific DNA-methyltransferase PglX n=1 Tax=unclassified Arthrobacter TaxID=235627 RepID=UPI00115D183D|nr:MULTISPECIES: BREX-1 system adenine-specific DNA-methyltransferase PglX [unclassified Arthrobacter]TQS91858.1 BREX-1 system adenine-specific DNA-methyltransferase PglX [Arthrobacter sp. TS-15]BCW06788.1 hypothetical protein NtRootA1_29260 [Arthrobacter sp. NtRootA1]
METAPLKSFAAWARTAIIREVTARISVVLASQELRQEQPKAIAALEKAVYTAGGGNNGRDTVADKVAYTWFNRIIALRFMDANGYTGIGVVSPERGHKGGQPEVLAEAKRGNIDSTVVTNKRTAETVTSLLNGTRRSDDPQGEAYALLLAEYCRHWNRSMPFMFEREGDYTELLIPANLLADDSVLARAATVLTEEVCEDVEVIGWLYQFYISERKDEVFAGFKKSRKAGAVEIPAATQLFTPHWIVRYLVENSLGNLWLLNRPTSRLAEQMDYYIAPVDEETDYLKISKPEELKIIDPACGSGHMLTYAFDLLYIIYEEEGYAPSEIPGLILANNLFGTEIDPRAGALAAFALTMKARAKQRTFFNKQVPPSICVIEPIWFRPDEIDFLVTRSGDRREEEAFWNQFAKADTLGSLIQPNPDVTARLAHHLDTLDASDDMLKAGTIELAKRVVEQATYLVGSYVAVIANPPYMSSATMNAQLTDFGREAFPSSKSDLFAMFIERSLELVVPRGLCAMVTMQSWMFLASFEDLRRLVLGRAPVQGLLHLGAGAFDTIGGAVVSTSAFVLQREAPLERMGVYVDLTRGRSEAEKQAQLREAIDRKDNVYYVRSQEFLVVPRSPFTYSLNERTVFARPSIGAVMESGGRLKTHGNAKYVRYHWEVAASTSRWRPFHNGGGQAAYYGNDEEVVDWSDDAVSTYGRHGGLPKAATFDMPGLTWSMVGSVDNSFRIREGGELFSSASPTLVSPSKPVALAYCAALNTPTMASLLRAINPTINNYVADVAALPQLDVASLDSLVQIGEAGLMTAMARAARSETSRVFTSLGMSGHNLSLQAWIEEQARTLEAAIASEFDLRAQAEGVVSADFGVSARPVVGEDSVPAGYVSERVRDVMSFAVGCMLGRYSLDEPGLILADQGAALHDYLAKVPMPTFTPDADNVIPIVDGDWFEDDIAERFRQFLRAAFGEQHFEANLRFIIQTLGVKNLRDYFVRTFYKDHVQRYRKRPIYWLFSSPKGSFNALIYMHRYTPSTVSTVLNEYLREFKAKLEASRQHLERLAAGSGSAREKAAAQKEIDRLRNVVLELDEYEHDVLYPLATQQVQIDLDDGVKVNYPKLGAALKKIPGLEASDE